MDRRSLREFVVDAHRNGYAASDGEPTSDGGTRIEYRDGDWRYVDRYYGSRAYFGSEVVSFEDEPVWGMHYSGEPIDSAVDHTTVYEALREALEQCAVDRPYRGPVHYATDPFVYRSSVDGALSRFTGTETIEREGEPVYRGQFGGGRIE